MKSYLKSAISLVKDAAWSFPTFKEKTIDEGGRFTMDRLSADEMDALLEHAFDRYYLTSGLFGTPEHCVALVERLSQIGVDEVACLIDFGVDADATLAGLEHLESLRVLYSERLRDRTTPVPVKSLGEIIEDRRITHMQCTPSMARMLVSDAQGRSALSKLSHLCVGGEALPSTLAATLGAHMSGTLQNMYGPTETTIWSSVADLTDMPADVTIGRPIANTKLYILDSDGHPVAIGLPGELYIAGDGVAAGYLDRPELTAERFISDPFAAAGGLMYRTGDRCRYRTDGALEFLGRTDTQTKIRGYRIELGEVEHELSNLDGVLAAVASVRDDIGEEPAIVGYVVEASPASFDADVALAALRNRLPEHMVPSRILTVLDFPMTPNGKVDRNRLPAPPTKAHRATATVAPRAGTEQLIAEVWTSVLDLDSVGADENFFDIGGHSLLAVQVNARLAEALGRELSLIDFFRYPTVRTLAAHLGADGDAQEVAAVEVGASRADARRAARRRGR
jgi:acyl carrier protein